jgi:hypothetical protein
MDPTRTSSQIPGYGSYQTRNYVMHRLNGTNGISNSCTWSYNWTAPASNEGAITFYACLLAANNNNTNDPGDETYFTQLTINPATTGISFEEKGVDKISEYPNPAKNVVSIRYSINEISSFKAELLDIQGKLIQVLFKDEKAFGTFEKEITLYPNIPSGIYLIRYSTDKGQSIKRIILQN